VAGRRPDPGSRSVRARCRGPCCGTRAAVTVPGTASRAHHPSAALWSPAGCACASTADTNTTTTAQASTATHRRGSAPGEPPALKITGRPRPGRSSTRHVIVSADPRPLDVAHVVATAVLYRCYLVTRDPKTAAAAGPAGLEVLDISETWD